MRAVLLSVILAITACAHSNPTTINVHSVRVAIKDRIEASPGEPGKRSITSMGKVTADSAQVFTESPNGRLEETWIKGDAGWTLRESHSVAANRE